jgi:hypothetical protein
MTFGQQTASSEHAACRRMLTEVFRELHQLQIELAVQRLDWHESRVQATEARIAAAADDRLLAEQEQTAAGEEMLNINVLLSRPDLQEEERAELQSLRNGLITDGQDRLRRRQAAVSDRVSTLSRELEKERSSAQQMRRRIEALRVTGPRVPAENGAVK